MIQTIPIMGIQTFLLAGLVTTWKKCNCFILNEQFCRRFPCMLVFMSLGISKKKNLFFSLNSLIPLPRYDIFFSLPFLFADRPAYRPTVTKERATEKKIHGHGHIPLDVKSILSSNTMRVSGYANFLCEPPLYVNSKRSPLTFC